MYEMNEEKQKRNRGRSAGKECAYLAVFVALLICSQLVLSALPAVEIVTALFFSYSFVFGIRRGALAGVAFSLLRQLLFGFFPTVLLLYLLYYPLTATLFGWLGVRVKRPIAALWRLVILACACTFAFSLLDSVITPLWYRFTWSATRAYFLASLPVALSQVICTAATVGLLFLPLERGFRLAKKGLLQ